MENTSILETLMRGDKVEFGTIVFKGNTKASKIEIFVNKNCEAIYDLTEEGLTEAIKLKNIYTNL